MSWLRWMKAIRGETGLSSRTSREVWFLRICRALIALLLVFGAAIFVLSICGTVSLDGSLIALIVIAAAIVFLLLISLEVR